MLQDAGAPIREKVRPSTMEEPNRPTVGSSQSHFWEHWELRIEYWLLVIEYPAPDAD